jgi:hypothetical protein
VRQGIAVKFVNCSDWTSCRSKCIGEHRRTRTNAELELLVENIESVYLKCLRTVLSSAIVPDDELSFELVIPRGFKRT